jgi:hypothetical protein
VESLAAVADPAATLPTQPFVPPAEDRAPVPGFVPDTFRAHPEGESSELESAGLGALSLAAMLAVAVAALRGIHTAVTNRRATREQRQAVADTARSGRAGGTSNANTSGGGGGRRVQSGHDYARRTLGRTGPSGGGGGGGGVSPTRNNTNNRSDGTNRRRDTGPHRPKAPNRKPDSSSSSGDRSRADRKEQRDRARREKTRGIHRPSQGSDTTTRSRLRRRGKSGTDTADGSSPSTRRGPAGSKGRGGRTKAPTDTSGSKGTLRAPKTKQDRRGGRLSLDKDTKGSARTRRRNGGGSGPVKTGPGKPKRGTSAKAAKAAESASAAGGTDRRTSLGEAISAESARRLKKRRKHLKPVVTVMKNKNKNKNRKKGPGKAGPSGSGTGPSSTKSASTSRPSTPKAGKMKWKRGQNKSGGSPWASTRRRIRTRWQRHQTTWTGAGGDFAGTPHGGRRRSPFEAAGMAAGAAYGTTYTVERADNPGDQERRWEPRPPRARQAAGAIAPPRPDAAPAASGPGPASAAESSSTKGAGMSLPANSTPGFNLAPSMSSEHTTEVTLDSTLDTLAGLTKDSFATHDEAVKLARKAKELRYALEELAVDLQSRHNVIGRITGAAMALLAESMEILSAKADAMAVNSLTAAELSEAAEQAMFDAYKPVQQATADAGLAVPSARVHNEG